MYIKAETTLIAYENEKEAQEAVVEALAGIYISRGQLLVSI